MSKKNHVDVRARQPPLREIYGKAPEEALIADRGRTTGGIHTDPFHCYVKPGSKGYNIVFATLGYTQRSWWGPRRTKFW